MSEYLIIACSGRALAESAKRAGIKVFVADFFADEDTSSFCEKAYQLQYQENGFTEEELIDLVQTIVSQNPDIKIVPTSGFEAAPECIELLQKSSFVLSNSKRTIDYVKEPERFFSFLEENNIPCPEYSLSQPFDTDNYLIKKIAGMGGEHIKWVKQMESEPFENNYFQKYVSGQAMSVVFLANGKESQIIGFNQQLQTDEFPDTPFLYKGAISLNLETVEHTKQIENIIARITEKVGLKGLCGLDYIVSDAGEIVVLEINPRPPATFELHENQQSLFAAHLAAINGELTQRNNGIQLLIRGYAILYAKENILINDKIEWPNWVKDRPKVGTQIRVKSPVCTVHAEEISLDKVKSILFNRLQQIRTRIAAAQNAVEMNL